MTSTKNKVGGEGGGPSGRAGAVEEICMSMAFAFHFITIFETIARYNDIYHAMYSFVYLVHVH